MEEEEDSYNCHEEKGLVVGEGVEIIAIPSNAVPIPGTQFVLNNGDGDEDKEATTSVIIYKDEDQKIEIIQEEEGEEEEIGEDDDEMETIVLQFDENDRVISTSILPSSASDHLRSLFREEEEKNRVPNPPKNSNSLKSSSSSSKMVSKNSAPHKVYSGAKTKTENTKSRKFRTTYSIEEIEKQAYELFKKERLEKIARREERLSQGKIKPKKIVANKIASIAAPKAPNRRRKGTKSKKSRLKKAASKGSDDEKSISDEFVEESWNCKYCSFKTYCGPQTLADHVHETHLNIDELCANEEYYGDKSEEESEAFSCDKCSFKLTNKQQLEEHIENVHEKRNKQCHLCFKIVDSKSELSDHNCFKNRKKKQNILSSLENKNAKNES